MRPVIDRLKDLFYAPRAGMFRAYHGISTMVAPADLELYRSLLPAAFSVPEQPKVVLFVADYVQVVPWPMTRYQEASVVVASTYAGEKGWYVLTMPVTKRVPMRGGRAIGFPKYIADEIRLEQVGDGWVGEEIHEGASRLRLEYTPGLTRDLEPWEREQWADPAFFQDVCHLLVPPGQGPDKVRVRFDQRVPPNWSPVMGMVRVIIEPNMPWAGLVPAETVAPGTFNRFTGGTNLVVEKMD